MVDYLQQPMTGLNLKRPITVSEVPQIPRYLDLDNVLDIIPPGYEEMVRASINTSVPEKPTVVLTFTNPEYVDMATVEIPQTLFNSKEAGVDVPLFLFEHSTNSKRKVDYFGANANYVLNMPQLVYMAIQHRLAHFTRKSRKIAGKQSKVFVGLMAGDFKRLKTFVQHEAPTTYNGYAKVEHTFAVILHKAHRHHSDLKIGETIAFGNPEEKDWKRILSDLQGYIQVSSESSMQKAGKITLAPKQIYRAPGFSLAKDGKSFTWICAPKQNIPARMKTHVLSDGYQLLNPAVSCFQQDNLFVNGEMINKDLTLKEAVVVYRSMDPVTKRFVAGEIEASPSIAEEVLFSKFSIEVNFRSDQDVYIEVGQKYDADFRPFVIGIDINDEEVKLYDIKSFEVLANVPSGLSGSSKVTIQATMRAGNARIISLTGHKGVTKIKSYNGRIRMPKVDQSFEELKPELLEYVRERNFNNYTQIPNKEIPKEWNSINVDLVMGMNAVKAKSNTIVLSQAALAVKYGYYIPKPKGKNGNYHGILDTLDVNEINDAANSLPEFIYTNEFGIPEKVFIGLAYISYTELGSVYTEFKPQSFAFESGWGIKNNSEELFAHIREYYLEEDKVAVAKDLYKILNDPKGLLQSKEQLPIYTVEDIREKHIFNPYSDLFRSRSSPWKSQSKLLSQEFNPKGFYIDLRKHGGPLIRIPCASTFETFISKLPNGEYTYHELMFNVSKIIQSIIGFREEQFDGNASVVNDKIVYPRANLSWIFDFYKTREERSYQYDLYMKSVQGTLYSTEDSRQMIVQSLIKPKIPGINMKQVVEPLLPDDVVVVMDDHLYRRVCKQAEHEDLLNECSPLQIDIELLKQCEVAENKLGYQAKWLDVLNNVPYCLAIRNPSLWESQLTNPRVWSRHHLEIWLKFKYNIKLSSYLHTKYNRDIVLVSPKVALISHSDCDGDLLPMAILNKLGQELLKEFTLHDMLEDEKEWNEAYWKDELDTDKDLNIDGKHVYQLYTISNVYDPTLKQPKNYPQFLSNACVAKGSIGSATIDIWALKAVLQWYRAYADRNNNNYVDASGNIIDRLPFRLTDYDLKYLPYVYTRLVQERVIEAIKHMEGGSSAFKMYFLDSITNEKNRNLVKTELENDFGVSSQQVLKLLGIISFAIMNENVLKAIKNFITKYNKGKIPSDPIPLNRWETEIQQSVYFGLLVQPLFDISQDIKQQQMKQVENRNQFTSEHLKTVTLSESTVQVGSLDLSSFL